MLKTNKFISALALSATILSVSTLAHAETPLPVISAMTNGNNQQMPTLAPLIEKVIPAVVNISVSGTKESQSFNIPEQFRFFFPEMGQMPKREFNALGSGVIIDAKKGYVITNAHVVTDATKIKVTLSDGRNFNAKKVGEDKQTDFAILQLEDFDNLTQIPFADSDSLRVGDFAIAIGNPFGLGQTVTSGIISALGRSGLNLENYENFIQTDAAINSGNSGGALINLRGELIGINTAILGKAGGNIGIGFAIPSNMAKSIMNQLLKHGKVTRGMLGIMGSEVTPDIAKNFDYDSVNGAFVNEVMPKSAAAKAGIKSGDILNSINGVPVKNFGQLRAKIATLGSGSKVTLGVFRDGKQTTVDVVLDSDDKVKSTEAVDNPIFEGVTLANNPDDVGVVIKEIKKNSRAARLNLKEGDVIVELNRKAIKTMADFDKALSDSNSFIVMKVLRGSAVIYITTNY